MYNLNCFDFKCDWLEFTYFHNMEEEPTGGYTLWDCFLDDLPEFEPYIEQMTLQARPLFGYSQWLRFNDEFSILYHPDQPEFGVHVTFPAHGLYLLCKIFKDQFNDPDNADCHDMADVSHLLKHLRDCGCRFSRLDICYDDYEKFITPEQYGRFCTMEQIQCKTKFMNFIKGNGAATFYLGKRGSDKMLRVYDKAKESGGLIDAIRYEFELRGDFLRMLISKFIDHEFFGIGDILDSMLTIKVPYDLDCSQDAKYQRKCRAEVLPEWKAFLDHLFAKRMLKESVPLVVPKKEKETSFSRRYEWIRKQVLPSLFLVVEGLGYDKFIDIVKSSSIRLKPHDWMMLQKYKQENDDGLLNFSADDQRIL